MSTYRKPAWLRATEMSRQLPRRSQRRKQQAAAEANQVVLRLPDRTTAIELANRKTYNRSTGTFDRADDAIIDKMIERAINGRVHRDIVELYRLLDAEEAIALSSPIINMSPYMRRKAKNTAKDIASVIWEFAMKQVEEGYLELTPDQRFQVPLYLQDALRQGTSTA